MSSAKPSLDLLRSLTEEHVLRALMDRRRLTRAEIAALTGISKPTISEGVRRLVEAGLVLDTGERSSGRGRAGSYYALAPDCGAALVVSITPHGVVAEAVDPLGAVVAAAEIALVRDAGAGAVGLALTEAVAEVGARVGAEVGASGAGRFGLAVVSAADPVDRRTGRLVHLPDAPFLVGDLDAPALLAGAVDGPVLVDNDVNWAARAERASGAVVGSSDFVYLYLDEGLGCAVVSDGEVRRGHAGLAGEVAHLLTEGPDGRAVRLTEVFAQLGLRRPGSTAIDVGLLRRRVADAPDGDATIAALGAAISGVLDAVTALADPEVVVVGGAWGRDDALVGELRRRSADLPRRAPVVAALAGDRPQLSGARAAALYQLRESVVAAVRAPAGDQDRERE
ncbi:ROK family transcriptional regulator [Terrabacter sp. Ter38]|uniref:ROK family transcriptional regulator n=1 Tax=Terrabacter sp. Ter38 TaxID=2926030 RepID=UPI0021194CCA|nr:ROK family transcriptional regulator [Terrabacter sp. Ter38]